MGCRFDSRDCCPRWFMLVWVEANLDTSRVPGVSLLAGAPLAPHGCVQLQETIPRCSGSPPQTGVEDIGVATGGGL